MTPRRRSAAGTLFSPSPSPSPSPFPSPSPVAVAAAAVAGVVLHLNTLGNGLAYDDRLVVGENPLVRSLSSLGAVFSSPYWGDIRPDALYRPLTIATYCVNYALGGVAPFGYHLVNVVLAGLVPGLAALLAVRLTGRTDVGLLAGLLFASHPAHTEAVAGVVGRAELLSAAFVLGALVLEARPTDRAGPARAAVAALLFLCALLSKESAAVLLPVLFLFEWRGREGAFRAAAAAATRALKYAAPLAVYLVLRARALEGLGLAVHPADNPAAAEGFPWSTLTAIKAFGLYAGKTVLPVSLSPDYSFDAIRVVRTPLDPGFLAGLFLLAVPLVFAIRFRAKAPAASFGVLFFLAAILPFANVFFPIGTILGERLLYLPSFGAVLALAAILARARAAAPAAGSAAAALVLVLFSARTLLRNPEWRDDRTLFLAAVRDGSRSARVHGNLGIAHAQAGDIGRAEAEFLAALEIDPDLAGVLVHLGSIHYSRGQRDEARRAWERAAKIEPGNPFAEQNLSVLAREEGRMADAERHLSRAVDASPRRPDLLRELGDLVLGAGRPADALAHYEAALVLEPGSLEARYGLAFALHALGRDREALPHARDLARRSPETEEFLRLLKEVEAEIGR